MKLLEYLFRGVGLTASISLLILGMAVLLYSIVEGFHVIQNILLFSTAEDRVIYNAMGIVDLILLSFSIFIAAVGIYELFVKPIQNLPAWIQVKDLDSLKGMLIKVVIVVMGISFMGRVVTWDGDENLLGYGLAVGAVVFALSYFINVKIKDKGTVNF
ncbi:MAG: YqhA family protein [Bacteroidota bacterium]